jgi:hypothetical protein
MDDPSTMMTNRPCQTSSHRRLSAGGLALLGPVSALGLCLLLVAGCGSDPVTVGSLCAKIGRAVCDRAIACGLGPASERKLCQDEAQFSCCEMDNLCGEKFPDDTSEDLANDFANACAASLPNYDCDELAAGNAPAECSALAAAAPAALAVEPVSRAPMTPAPLAIGRSDKVRRMVAAAKERLRSKLAPDTLPARSLQRL